MSFISKYNFQKNSIYQNKCRAKLIHPDTELLSILFFCIKEGHWKHAFAKIFIYTILIYLKMNTQINVLLNCQNLS